MSWLYEHRDQSDGLRPFVEIAYRTTYGIDQSDRDDLEQDIVIALMRVSQRNAAPGYLWGVARKEVKKYWCRRCYRRGKFRPYYEREEFPSGEGDIDARLDALAVLLALPKRLVEIGYDRLNGKKLSAADQRYWIRQKARLDCRRNGREVSDWERRRIARLYEQGFTVKRISKITGRHEVTVKRCLNRK